MKKDDKKRNYKPSSRWDKQLQNNIEKRTLSVNLQTEGTTNGEIIHKPNRLKERRTVKIYTN